MKNLYRRGLCDKLAGALVALAASATGLAVSLGASTAAHGAEPALATAAPEPYAYVAFKAAGESNLVIAARLTLPGRAARPMPAVVIVHGSAGVDGRSIDHAQALQRAGIATLEVDLWSARWPQGGPLRRPRGVPETLPDAYGALAFLATHSAIDKSRIGIMGFSWGGVVSMLAATRDYADKLSPPGVRFAAHAPFYPVCWLYNKLPGYGFAALTGAPVLLHAGERDDYEGPGTCNQMKAGLAAADSALLEVVNIPGATHAFDRRGDDITVPDPYSHFGRGGDVRMHYLPDATAAARERTVDFFRRRFGLVPR
jgi:dienelactone hydrolase